MRLFAGGCKKGISVELTKNQRLEVVVDAYGNSGEGIAHVDGYALFIKGALPGERVSVVVTKVKKNYGYARLLEVLEESPDRVEPVCSVYGRCGGCKLQHMSYEAQLRFKTGRVYDCLTRIGGVKGLVMPEEHMGSFAGGPEEADLCGVMGPEEAVRLEVIGCDEPDEVFYYRNKAQFPVGYDKSGDIVAGFYAVRSHDIIPCKRCFIQDRVISDTIEKIIEIVNNNSDKSDYKNGKSKGGLIYDESSHSGLIRHIYIRHGRSTGQLAVYLVVNMEEERAKEVFTGVSAGDDNSHNNRLDVKNSNNSSENVLVSILKDIIEIDTVTGVCININSNKTNVITGDTYIQVFWDIFIEDNIGDISFKISPQSFYQVNSYLTEKLYDKALEYAALTGEETVWDLYCGIGTISLFFAKKAGKVLGVEIVPEAIENAKENAKRNGIDNAVFICGAAEDVIAEAVEHGNVSEALSGQSDESEHRMTSSTSGAVNADEESSQGIPAPDVVVVDPPRKGCDEKLIATIGTLLPGRIVYVSCDPATLARDIARLREYGYELRKACVVDQFWQTEHVETVVLLSKLHEAKHHVNVKLDMDELNLTSAEAKSTYKEIQDWVQEKYGFHVTNLNIAQVKQKHGLIERENYNKPQSPDSRQPGCPEEKVKAIEDAMRHFQMM